MNYSTFLEIQLLVKTARKQKEDINIKNKLFTKDYYNEANRRVVFFGGFSADLLARKYVKEFKDDILSWSVKDKIFKDPYNNYGPLPIVRHDSGYDCDEALDNEMKLNDAEISKIISKAMQNGNILKDVRNCRQIEANRDRWALCYEEWEELTILEDWRHRYSMQRIRDTQESSWSRRDNNEFWDSDEGQETYWNIQ